MPSVLKNLVEKMVIKFRFGSEKREKWGVVRVWELGSAVYSEKTSCPGSCHDPGLMLPL